MFGCIVLGGLLTFAALRIFRYRRLGGCWHHHRYGRGGPGGFGRHFPDGGPGGYGEGYEADRESGSGSGLPFYLRYLSRRLYASPTQERTIAEAMEQFRKDVAPVRAEADKTRADLAATLRKPSFDEVMMGELFARHDDALEKLRKAAVGLGARVHEALDERQREQLASMVERGPGFFRGGSRFGWNW